MPRTQQIRNKGEGSTTKTPNGKHKANITIEVGIDSKKKTPSISETSFGIRCVCCPIYERVV